MKNTTQEFILPNFSTVIDDIFGSETISTIKRNLTPSIPQANIYETTKSHLIELASPGMEKTDFKIELIDNKLNITSNKNNSSEVEVIKTVRKEFNYSNFKRTFSLPKNCDTNKIDAKYLNGILKITITKKEIIEKKNINISIE